MALIKFGGGVAAASGKVAGTVYARNRSGAYQRNWAKPVNPGTALQSGVRAALSAAATGWAGLTAAQVEAWNAYANTMTRLNRLGDSYVPTGRQIYIEQAMNAFQTLGVLLVKTTPGPTNVSPSLNDNSITAAAATANLFTSLIMQGKTDIPSHEPTTDAIVLMYSAPAHPAQKQNLNKQRRLIATLSGDEYEGSASIHAAWNTYFGATATDGLVVDLWARLIDPGTNLASPLVKLNATIT